MTPDDENAAALALYRWFVSQEISDLDACGVMMRLVVCIATSVKSREADRPNPELFLNMHIKLLWAFLDELQGEQR